jgi:hypothetical protein
MRYSTMKVMIVIVTVVLMLVGFLVSGNGAFGIAFATFALLLGGFNYRRVRRFERLNFAAYRTAHPDLVQGDRVSCSACGHDRILVRSLLQNTSTRAHVCARCGHTLYYSPEYA